MVERASALGAEIVELKGDRLQGLPKPEASGSYREAKSTLAITVASPAKRRRQPIPPSADWRFDLAEGCPAHCQYCYLAGSLSGPPITRAYANLDEILAGLETGLGSGGVTSRNAARAEIPRQRAQCDAGRRGQCFHPDDVLRRGAVYRRQGPNYTRRLDGR